MLTFKSIFPVGYFIKALYKRKQIKYFLHFNILRVLPNWALNYADSKHTACSSKGDIVYSCVQQFYHLISVLSLHQALRFQKEGPPNILSLKLFTITSARKTFEFLPKKFQTTGYAYLSVWLFSAYICLNVMFIRNRVMTDLVCN